MIWGYGSAWFFTLIPNPTSKPPQTMLKTRLSQKFDFHCTSTLNSPYGFMFIDLHKEALELKTRLSKRPSADAATPDFYKNWIFDKIGF